MKKKKRPFEDEVQFMNEKYSKIKLDKSDLVVNANGQLCEVLDLESATFVHVFNCLRDDPWVGISFSFNPRFIDRENGW